MPQTSKISFPCCVEKKNTWTLICFYRPKRSYLKFLLTHYVSSPQITELCIFAHILRLIFSLAHPVHWQESNNKENGTRPHLDLCTTYRCSPIKYFSVVKNILCYLPSCDISS